LIAREGLLSYLVIKERKKKRKENSRTESTACSTP
jgi:hypothetical protein